MNRPDPGRRPSVRSSPDRWTPEREWSSGSQRQPDDTWRPLIDPAKVVGGVWKSRYLIAGTTFAGAVLAALIAISTPKEYTSVAELLVDPRELQIVSNDVTGGGGLSSEATLAIVENQVRVLTSGSVLTTVVERLGLDKDPEFNGSREGIGRYIPNVRELLFSSSDAGDPTVLRRGLAVESLAKSLNVERGGRTFVVEIWATTESPQKSAMIANTLAEVFLETSGAIQSRTVGRASDELTERLAELRRSVEIAEREVEAFKSQNDIVDAQGRLITDDEIVKLNDQLATARARTLELQARADSTRDLTVDAVLAGNLPEQMSSPVLTEMRTQYSLLRQEADRITARLGPRHPERMAIDQQVAAARGRIEQELRLVASSIQVELRRAVQLEQELAARLAQLKARQAGLSEELVTLRELEREASAKRAVYEAFLLRARETGEQKGINTANVSVISPAMPPLEASSMPRSIRTVFGAILGFGAGVLFGAGRGTIESLTGSSGPDRRHRPIGHGQPLAPRRPAPSTYREEPDLGAEDEEEDQIVGRAADPKPSDIGSKTSEPEVRARSEAQESSSAEMTADSAEEADMYHQKPQNAWVPSNPADNHPTHPGYANPHHPSGSWPDHPQAGPGQYRDFAQPNPGPGFHHHQAAPAYGYANPGPMQHGPQQGYAHPRNPAAYPPQGGAYPPAFGEQQHSHGYPAERGQPMNPAPAMYGQPVQPWQYGPLMQQYYAPAALYGQMPVDPRQGYGPAASPDLAYGQNVHPRASLQDAPVQQTSSAPVDVRSTDSAEKNAIDEIRESLHEFREALRELAETRGRRRFL